LVAEVQVAAPDPQGIHVDPDKYYPAEHDVAEYVYDTIKEIVNNKNNLFILEI